MVEHVGEKANLLPKWLVGAIVLIALAVPPAFGQASGTKNGADGKFEKALVPNAVYEVATIRPADPTSRAAGIGTRLDGTFYSRNLALSTVVRTAYDLMPFQLEGGPAWLESERYDIEAKPDAAVEEELLKFDSNGRDAATQRMLQELLAARLKLKVHFETREMPVLALMIAKGGVKMRESNPADGYANGLKGNDGKPVGGGRAMMDVSKAGYGKIVAQGVPIDRLVALLTGATGHLVSNRTGLTGLYDFTLQYSDDQLATPEASEPSLTDALREQLGLKLESNKGPVQVLVVDHVERPSEN